MDDNIYFEIFKYVDDIKDLRSIMISCNKFKEIMYKIFINFYPLFIKNNLNIVSELLYKDSLKNLLKKDDIPSSIIFLKNMFENRYNIGINYGLNIENIHIYVDINKDKIFIHQHYIDDQRQYILILIDKEQITLMTQINHIEYHRKLNKMIKNI